MEFKKSTKTLLFIMCLLLAGCNKAINLDDVIPGIILRKSTTIDVFNYLKSIECYCKPSDDSILVRDLNFYNLDWNGEILFENGVCYGVVLSSEKKNESSISLDFAALITYIEDKYHIKGDLEITNKGESYNYIDPNGYYILLIDTYCYNGVGSISINCIKETEDNAKKIKERRSNNN